MLSSASEHRVSLLSLHPCCDGDREVAAPALFCCCVQASDTCVKHPEPSMPPLLQNKGLFGGSGQPGTCLLLSLSETWLFTETLQICCSGESHCCPTPWSLSERWKLGSDGQEWWLCPPRHTDWHCPPGTTSCLPGSIPLALFYPLQIRCPAVLLTWRKRRSALLFALEQEPCRRGGQGGCALQDLEGTTLKNLDGICFETVSAVENSCSSKGNKERICRFWRAQWNAQHRPGAPPGISRGWCPQHAEILSSGLFWVLAKTQPQWFFHIYFWIWFCDAWKDLLLW